MTDNDRKAAAQDAQYAFPYHHLPTLAQGRFRRSRGLTWSFEYLCYVRHVVELVEDLAPRSVLDIGCGDGLLLQMLSGLDVETLVGVERSERAAGLARSMCSDRIDLHVGDVTDLPSADDFDVVTLIEVLEHVPAAEIPAFCHAMRQRVTPGGSLIVCVPGTAIPVTEKHHRHYTADHLVADVLADDDRFEVVSLTGVYHEPRWLTAYQRATVNRAWRIEVTALDTAVWRRVWHRRVVPPALGRHLVLHVTRRPGPG